MKKWPKHPGVEYTAKLLRLASCAMSDQGFKIEESADDDISECFRKGDTYLAHSLENAEIYPEEAYYVNASDMALEVDRLMEIANG